MREGQQLDAVDIRGAVIAAYSRRLTGKGWLPDGIDTLSATYVDLALAAIHDAGLCVRPADDTNNDGRTED